MSDQITWILTCAIKPDAFDDFTAVMNDMIAATRENEPGTEIYEWSVSDDKSTCQIIERYKNAAAAMTHMKNFGTQFAGRFLACLKPQGLTVYGAPDDQLRKALAQMQPVYMAPAAGFAR